MRINDFYKYMLFLSLLSCNMSDYNEEITNGYQYNFESSDKCLNSIINPEKRIEDFGVFDIKYNDIYISYYVLDSSFCANRQYDEKIDTIKAKGYIINTETYLKIGPLSREKNQLYRRKLKINKVFGN